MLLQLGGYYSRRIITQAEVIAALFGAGEQGAFYDPSDLSTLFQDVTGTTPVTADSEPVGLMFDVSGNNNHALQSTAAARHLYRAADGLHWLQSDGVDDYFSIPHTDQMNFGQGSFWVAAALNMQSTDFRVVWGKGRSTSANNIRLFIRVTDKLAVAWGSDSQLYSADGALVSRNNTELWEWGVDADVPAQITTKNGVEHHVGITLSGVGSNTQDARIAQDTNASYISEMKLYSMIIRKGNNPNKQQKALARIFMAQKAGVNL